MLQQQKRRRVGKSLYNWWYHTTRFDNQTTCSFFLVTEGLLASLHTLFPLQSVTALDLIDHRSVSLLTSPSGRKIYSCLGSLCTPYLIPYTGFTCTCPSYRHNLNSENLWCPHLLAVQLSIAMDIVQQKQVTEDVMKTLLSELVMFDD